MVNVVDKYTANNIQNVAGNSALSEEYTSCYEKDQIREKKLTQAYEKELTEGEKVLAAKAERQEAEKKAKAIRKKIFVDNLSKKIRNAVKICVLVGAAVIGIGVVADKSVNKTKVTISEKPSTKIEQPASTVSTNEITMPKVEMYTEEVPVIQLNIGKEKEFVGEKPVFQASLEAVSTDVCQKCGNKHVATKGKAFFTIPLGENKKSR
jgi:hypothetical protein